MRKPFKRIISLFLAAVTAAAVLAVNASALTVCIGGKCYDITFPSGCTICTLPTIKQITVQTNRNTCQSVPVQAPSSAVTGVIPTGGDAAASTEAAEVHAIVNRERAANGLSALTMSAELNRLAEIRAQEIVRSFSHTRPDGQSCFSVLKENGVSYRYAGENIAYGQTSASSVMNAWMNSSGHRSNILGKNFGKIGVACYISGGRKYWVQIFTD